MDRKTSFGLLLIGMTLATIIGLLLAGLILPPPGSVPPPPPASEEAPLIFVKVVISMVNLSIIFPLLTIYFKLYREMKSQFTLGLIVVTLVLFLYALTSNPLLHIVFGFYASGLGLFTIIPDIFSTVALLTLFYLSLE